MRSLSDRLAALLVGAAVMNGCGGDDAKKSADEVPDASAAGGGGGSGGTPATDAGPTGDATPPDFQGATGAEIVSDRKVRVLWDPAKDDETAESAIAYRVYRAPTAGGQDFDAGTRCGDGDDPIAACYRVAPAGATGVTFTDITPDTDFYFVARALDAEGNEDDNTTEVGTRTSDATPPEFGGVNRATVLTPTSIEVTWNDGYDRPTPASEIHYEVFVEIGERPDPTTATPVYTSDPGELSTVITGLDPETTYWVYVRSVDPTGNSDANERFVAVRTPEGIPPAFDGAKRATAAGTTVTVFWTPGTDNGTDQLNLVYDVWESLTSRGQSLSGAPTYTSEPGRASIKIPDREPGTRYYYVVRARDVAGNRDSNFEEVSATTGGLPDTQPPTFNGVQAVTGSSPSALLVTWGSATDNNVLNDSIIGDGTITFDVYVSATSPVPLDTPFLSTRLTSASILGLSSGATRYVVVQARDEAGNVDGNTKEVSGATIDISTTAFPADAMPPTWGGGPTADLVPGRGAELEVAWTAASDDNYAATDVRYHVCLSEVEADCLDTAFASHVVATSGFGATGLTLTGLTPRTTYFVVVRAEDRSGNLEPSGHSVQAITATSWSRNVRPLLFDRCIACHSGADRALLSQVEVEARDTIAFDKANEIVNVYGSLLDDAACLVRRDLPDGGTLPIDPENGCRVKLIDPGHPEHSLIYRKVNPIDLETPPFSAAVPNKYVGSREPRDTGDNLTGEEDSILRDWIEQGAVSD